MTKPKLNEYTKALNEMTADVIKSIKEDQVKTFEIVQRLRRLENSINYPNETGGQSGDRPRQGFVRQNNNQQGGFQQGGYNNNRPGGFNNSGTAPRPGGFNNQNRDGGQDGRPNFQNRGTQGGDRPNQGGQRAAGGGYGGQRSGYNNSNNNKQSASTILPVQEKERVSNYDPNKNTYQRNNNDLDKRLQKSRKQFIRSNANTFDDERMYNRKLKKRPELPKPEPVIIDHAIISTETVTVKELSEKIGKPSSSIIKQLLVLGMLATINQEIDFDTAQLICTEFNITLEQKLHKTSEDELIEEDVDDDSADLINRPPVVTIMGHVDHGKTSLLDAIRQTKVTAGEAGGITQHIGAYSIEINDRKITFLDTPGHEAFTSMRARGAQVTDVAILVVAADDGIMPQTIEAINHAKAADVPIIVAINKIDKPAANIEKVKQELTEHNLVWEEWGGDTVITPVSAHTKEGIKELLEMVLLVADVQELKANPNRKAKGAIIEAKLDKGRGPVATVLIQNGTLRVGDTIVAGTSYGHVRAMVDDTGANVMVATPSMPIEVLGLGEVPNAGDVFYAVEDDKLSRQVAEERKDKIKVDQIKRMSKVSLEDLFDQISEGEMKVLNLIVKADVQGSAEALRQSLEKLHNEQVKINVIHCAVGAITKADVMFADASNAIIIGFNIVPDPIARAMAEKDKIDIRTYRVIYSVIEDIEKALTGMLDPEFKEVIQGHVEIRQVFKVSNVGTIGGSFVIDGKITRNSQVRLSRDGVVIHEGEIASLKRFKNDAKEVASGYECGVGIEGYNDIKEGDIVESYILEEVKR